MENQSRRNQPATLLIVMLLSVASIGLFVYLVELAKDIGIGEELIFAAMFGGVGVLLYRLYLTRRNGLWKIAATLALTLSLIGTGVWFERLGMHPALVIASMFSSIALVIYVLYGKGSADARPLSAALKWDQLGDRRSVSPAERDVPAPR